MLTSKELEITKDLILGKFNVELSSFAFKIFLQQLRVQHNLGQYESDINSLWKKTRNCPVFGRILKKYTGERCMGKLCSIEEVEELIKQDRLLVLAGPKSLLEELPVGKYIAGSCYYFIDEGVGLKVDDKLCKKF